MYDDAPLSLSNSGPSSSHNIQLPLSSIAGCENVRKVGDFQTSRVEAHRHAPPGKSPPPSTSSGRRAERSILPNFPNPSGSNSSTSSSRYGKATSAIGKENYKLVSACHPQSSSSIPASLTSSHDLRPTPYSDSRINSVRRNRAGLNTPSLPTSRLVSEQRATSSAPSPVLLPLSSSLSSSRKRVGVGMSNEDQTEEDNSLHGRPSASSKKRKTSSCASRLSPRNGWDSFSFDSLIAEFAPQGFEDLLNPQLHNQLVRPIFTRRRRGDASRLDILAQLPTTSLSGCNLNIPCGRCPPSNTSSYDRCGAVAKTRSSLSSFPSSARKRAFSPSSSDGSPSSSGVEDSSSTSSSSDSSSDSSSPSPSPPSWPPPCVPAAASFPFAGSYSGASWNARAFFSCKAGKMGKNFDKVLSGMRGTDFFAIQETHSSSARALASEDELGDTFQFWSHGTTAASGIGLVVSKKFAARFSHTSWHVLIESRLAVYRCWGNEGSLDIWVVYADATSPSSRKKLVSSLTRAVAGASSSLSIVVGDFNFVECDEDRIAEGVWKGSSNRDEAHHFKTSFAQPLGFAELEQDCYTYRSASLPTTFSKIDRVYSNHHTAEQLQADFFCGVLPWPSPELSDHRPIRFGRRSSSFHPSSSLPSWTLNHPDWASWAQQEYLNCISDLNGRAGPFQDLACLKDAFKNASSRIMHNAAWPEVRTEEDKLNLFIVFLRAVERGNVKTINRCRARLGELDYAFGQGDIRLDRVALNKIRDEVVRLSRNHFLTLKDALIEEGPQLPEQVLSRKKEQIDRKFARLVPGSTSSIAAMQDENGEVLTDDAEIAGVLARHWAEVLSDKAINEVLLQEWLLDIDPLPDDFCWEPEEKDMKTAVQVASESSPGPDGIPYKAYKLFPGAAHILFKVAIFLLTVDDVQLPEGFNAAFLCCLAKKPLRDDPRMGPIFTAEGTRPLSIVNTDNRLIASFFRIHLESIFSRWVSAAQRGFIRGRSMMANIIDIDLQSMLISLKHPFGALILFDFKAAFPSVSHKYMWAVLRRIGVPRKWVKALKRLYVNNVHFVKFRGKTFGSFTTSSGVRQGCPVSPLIFAVVADVLLRKLASYFPLQMVRAFADDTAMIVDHFHRHAEVIMFLFQQFGRISNLKLNLPKTVIIPLWHTTIPNFQLFLRSDLPSWAAVTVAFAAKYLGYLVGPQSHKNGWSAAIAKFRARVRQWEEVCLGMQYDCRVYRVFMFSLFGFLAQLTVPPKEALEAEKWALRRVAKGPGNWCRTSDLFQLKDAFGFPYSFPSLEATARAAKLRVMEYEEVDFRGCAEQLSDARYSLDRVHVPSFAAWYDASYVKAVVDCCDLCRRVGVTSSSIQDALREKYASTKPGAISLVIRRNFQCTAVSQLIHNVGYAERRLRHRLQRWKLPDPPAHVVARAIRRLDCIFKLVPPRVAVVLFSSYFNRWTTSRRFQGEDKCRLCGGGGDSIEHIARCPVQTSFATNFLKIPPQHRDGLQGFFGLNNGISDKDLVLVTLNLYACYTARNKLTRSRLAPSQVEALLVQLTRQAIMRHPSSRRIVEDHVGVLPSVPSSSRPPSSRGGQLARRAPPSLRPSLPLAAPVSSSVGWVCGGDLSLREVRG